MNFSFIKSDWDSPKIFKKKVSDKMKFNKNLVYKLKFYVELIETEIKHVWMHLHALNFNFKIIKYGSHKFLTQLKYMPKVVSLLFFIDLIINFNVCHQLHFDP